MGDSDKKKLDRSKRYVLEAHRLPSPLPADLQNGEFIRSPEVIGSTQRTYYWRGTQEVTVPGGNYFVATRHSDGRTFLCESSMLVAEIRAQENGDEHNIVRRGDNEHGVLAKFRQEFGPNNLYFLLADAMQPKK